MLHSVQCRIGVQCAVIALNEYRYIDYCCGWPIFPAKYEKEVVRHYAKCVFVQFNERINDFFSGDSSREEKNELGATKID